MKMQSKLMKPVDQKRRQNTNQRKLLVLQQISDKVEKMIQMINNQQFMPQLCENKNIINVNEQSPQFKDSKAQQLIFGPVKSSIRNSIPQSKEVQQGCKQFETKQPIEQLNSQSQGIDKKSLLTEMLRQSQNLDDQNQICGSLKKGTKRPMSQVYPLANNYKKLLKQIDFSGYQIQGSPQRRQKKVNLNNCGQCSQCTIF